jgi:cell division protein ZapA
MKRAVDVEIMGHKYTVRSDADERYVLKVAEYVDEKVQDILKTARPIANPNVAMLAALNIADEYHRLKDDYETVLHRLNDLSKRLSTTLSEEG